MEAYRRLAVAPLSLRQLRALSHASVYHMEAELPPLEPPAPQGRRRARARKSASVPVLGAAGRARVETVEASKRRFGDAEALPARPRPAGLVEELLVRSPAGPLDEQLRYYPSRAAQTVGTPGGAQGTTEPPPRRGHAQTALERRFAEINGHAPRSRREELGW